MIHRLATAGVSFVLAAGSGFVLQHGFLSQAPAPAGPAAILTASIVSMKAEIAAAPATETGRAAAALPDLPDLPQDPPPLGTAGSDGLAGRIAALDAAAEAPGQGAAAAPYDDFGRRCTGAALTLKAEPGAVLAASYDNPCAAGSAVILSQGDLALRLLTDARGHAETRLPALGGSGQIVAGDDTGAVASADFSLPQPAAMSRIAVASGFAGLLRLSAGGAAAEQVLSSGLWVQEIDAAAAEAPLMLHAAVTPESCGREIAAQVAVTHAGRSRVQEVTLAMPACASGAASVALLLPAPADQR